MSEEIYRTVCRLNAMCDLDEADIIDLMGDELLEYRHSGPSGERKFHSRNIAVRVILKCEKYGQFQAKQLELKLAMDQFLDKAYEVFPKKEFTAPTGFKFDENKIKRDAYIRRLQEATINKKEKF